MVTVWYPAGPGGKNVTLGESPLFMGTEAMLNAPIAEGQYPVVLLSHGAGLAGTPEAMSWIAVPLAKQGYVVAAPLHLGNGGIDRSATETIKLWLRPPDISATLDVLQRQPFLENHLQLGSVGVLGLSMVEAPPCRWREPGSIRLVLQNTVTTLLLTPRSAAG
ncbi:alpha/beta hydrolase family protein [Pseudorhizobium sp. NPDC055634]